MGGEGGMFAGYVPLHRLNWIKAHKNQAKPFTRICPDESRTRSRASKLGPTHSTASPFEGDIIPRMFWPDFAFLPGANGPGSTLSRNTCHRPSSESEELPSIFGSVAESFKIIRWIENPRAIPFRICSGFQLFLEFEVGGLSSS